MLGTSQFLAEGLVGCGVGVVPPNIAQQTAEFFERGGVNSPVLLETISNTSFQCVEIGCRPSDAYHRPVQVATFDHGLERWEDFLESEIACRSEEDQRVRMWSVHACPLPASSRPSFFSLKAVSPSCSQRLPKRGTHPLNASHDCIRERSKSASLLYSSGRCGSK